MSKNKNPPTKNTPENAQIKVEQTYLGPIPPPSFLKAYEEIVPGAAKEILSMAVKNSDHAIAMDKEQIKLADKQLNNHGRGQNYALICFVVVAVLTAYAIYAHESIVGIAAIVSEITGLSIALIYGKYIDYKKNK